MAPVTSYPRGLVAALRDARHVVALTGAGVSAESGVPTFREAATGLWAQYDPLELATPEAFQRDPALVWRWYRWRRELIARSSPNAGHLALSRLARLVRQFTLITQNVDDLHQRAGSRDLVEYHGNIFTDLCSREMKAVVTDSAQTVDVPVCPDCGAHARPGVVWFGEAIPGAALQRASTAAAECDVFLSIGTSALVWPAAGLASVARQAGALIVEINPERTELSPACDYQLHAKSGLALPELVDSLSPPVTESETRD
jgi:NAD-dependent deacetylase